METPIEYKGFLLDDRNTRDVYLSKPDGSPAGRVTIDLDRRVVGLWDQGAVNGGVRLVETIDGDRAAELFRLINIAGIGLYAVDILIENYLGSEASRGRTKTS